MSEEQNEILTVEDKTIQAISRSYIDTQLSIAKQLRLETPNHHLTTGTTRERVWLKLFESIVPKKFCIDQGVFIIDSYGKISSEVDLAIFDESYTPYIFKFENIKFIPIEAVAVAVQCKSKKTDGVISWSKSIKKLKTSYDALFRIYNGVVNSKEDFEKDGAQAKSQTSTRPILVLCTAVEGASISKNVKTNFDIVLSVDQYGGLKKTIAEEDRDYDDWYRSLNHFAHSRYEEERAVLEELVPKKLPTHRNLEMLKVKANGTDEENVLLSLTFQLNQLLMLINNPMPFPHQAYADMFREHYEKFSKLNIQVEEAKGSKK